MCPGPKNFASFTAPAIFIPDDGPNDNPSFLRRLNIIFSASLSSIWKESSIFASLKLAVILLCPIPSVIEDPSGLALPVLIQDSSSNFRKIRDHENNSGWIHISQLSKKKAAIVTDDDLLMFERATIYSNPVAILKKGRLVKINKCKEGWCKVKSSEFKGWIKNVSLWGLF